jgi:hypothetical protein
MELEALCIELGISEHIPALSEFRDKLLRATAAQLQEAALDVAAKTAELATTKEALNAAQAELAALQ